MARANQDGLVMVMDSTFTDVEMVTAKDLLWEIGCQVAGADLLGRNSKRVDSENRTKRFMLCTDVAEAMQKLDQCGKTMPTFVCDADGVGRMPTFSPEDYNVVTLDQRCRQLERDMKSMQHMMTLRTESWSKLDDQVDHMEVAMTQHARCIRRLDTEIDAKSVPVLSGSRLTDDSQNPVSKTANKCPDVDATNNVDENKLLYSSAVLTQSTGATSTLNVTPTQHDLKSDNRADTMKDNMLKDGFQYTKDYKDKIKKQSKRRAIQGTATDSEADFGAAELVPVHKLFLTQVRNDVTIDSIKKTYETKKYRFCGYISEVKI